MRTFLKVIVGTILLAGVFLAGATAAGIRHWFQPVIEVSVANVSGLPILGIEVSLESGGQRSFSSLGPLENGKQQTYRFYLAGEGEYSLTATLGSGRKVSSVMGYVQSGYSIKETVMENSIKSETSFYGL